MKRPLLALALLYICILLILSSLHIPLTQAVREGTPLAEGEERQGVLRGTLGRISRTGNGSVQLEMEEAEFCGTGEAKGEAQNWHAGTVLVYADKDLGAPLGSRLVITGIISLFPAPDNPGEFDRQAYYKAQNILLRMTAEEVTAEGQVKAYPIRNAAGWLRAWLGEGLSAVFEEEDAGILRALLLGDRSGLSESLSDLYEAAGIRHVLTVSGLHVSLAAGAFSLVFSWLFSFIPWGRLPGIAGRRGFQLCRAIAAGAAVCFYTELAGCGLPLRRAAIMYLLFLFAQAAGQSYDLFSALSAAFLAAALPCPYVIFQGSFQLSFVCVLIIGGIFPIVSKLMLAETTALKTILLPSLLQLLTAPLQLWHYYTYHPLGSLANLLILPLVMWILIFGAAAACLAHVFLPAGAFAAGPAHLALVITKKVAEGIVSLPLSTLITGRPGFWQIVLYLFLAAGLLLLMIRIRKRRAEIALTAIMSAGNSPVRRFLRESSALVLVMALAGFSLPTLFLLKPENRSLTITSLYVGQGDCHVICADGEAWLIDGGSSYTSPARSKILPYLKYAGIRKLSFIMVSHGDEDHMNGLAEVMAADGLTVDELIVSAWDRGSGKTASLEQTALSHGIPVRSAAEGGTLTKGSLSFRILSPALSRPNEENDYSLVLLISRGSFRGLFTGDISAETEMQLIERYGDLLRDLDYLKDAHHGSRFSSCEDFIRLTSPTFAVISCGRNNSYGHPHEETLERLREGESTALRTDLAGAVRVSVNEENSLTIECYRSAGNIIKENFPETGPLTAMHTMEGQINKRRRDEE